jgi:3-dehydroquinate synthase
LTEIAVEVNVREPLQRFMRDRHPARYVVLCDLNVERYARTLTRGIPGRLATLPFRLGEKAKHLGTVEQVLEALMRAGADRSTAIVGFGGGVAGDLFGFAASIFMRGVPYVHVATSLVSMVDASIGGKTGVDLPSGKNLAGTFADPVAIFAHVGALATLPYRHIREGLAEVVKHAIIEGGELFELLEMLAPLPFTRWPWQTIVEESQKVKLMIVADDRLEQGVRELLNLGHTFGHAIERASNYRITHGAGVSLGLRAAGLLALRTGRFSREDHLRVITLLALLRMPLWTRERPERILAAMSADKKRRDGKLRFVLPRSIGDVEHGVVVPERSVRAVLQRLGAPPGDHELR